MCIQSSAAAAIGLEMSWRTSGDPESDRANGPIFLESDESRIAEIVHAQPGAAS